VNTQAQIASRDGDNFNDRVQRTNPKVGTSGDDGDSDDSSDGYGSDGFESDSPRRVSPKRTSVRTTNVDDFNARFNRSTIVANTRVASSAKDTVRSFLKSLPWTTLSAVRVALAASHGRKPSRLTFAAASQFAATKWLLSALPSIAHNYRGESARATAIVRFVQAIFG